MSEAYHDKTGFLAQGVDFFHKIGNPAPRNHDILTDLVRIQFEERGRYGLPCLPQVLSFLPGRGFFD